MERNLIRKIVRVIRLHLRNRGSLFFLLIVAWGCGSSNDELTKPTTNLGSAEQQFAQAKTAFAKEDYPEAIRLFDEVRVQAPASTMAAEATYLEAMSRYKQESYAAAAVDFRAVRRNYPSSPFAERAQYMVGESYYEISPRAELDQSYTVLALAEFQNYLHDYPAPVSSSPSSGSPSEHLASLADSAQARILEIRSRLAEKAFHAATLYDKLEDYKAATIYYERVLDNYYDTEPATESELRLAELNFQRKKLDDARADLEAFDSKYLPKATPAERDRALRLHSKLQVNP